MDYKLTIGLEIHAELATKTKMFCGCLNNPDEVKPNVNICPICMGHPGTLPVINREAVRSVLRVGEALGGKLANFTEFDRKNYFYPDIPKGYQISQYKYSLVSGGKLKGVEITRVHLEEDTARSQHIGNDVESLVDFNRAGVPLMELVTEPVIKSAKEAGDFARELRLLLSPAYLNVSEANMEKGEMRVEANISISKDDSKFGTKVEVKNLNSFKAVEKAIEYEYERQKELLDKGEEIVQETRGWDENRGVTFSQRRKELSHDYRYFPDPDLPKIFIKEIPDLANLSETLPELPEEKRQKFLEEFKLKESDVEVLVGNVVLADFFEAVALGWQRDDLYQLSSNYILSDLASLLVGGANLPTPENFRVLIEMIADGDLSSRGAKDVLPVLLKENKSPKMIAEEKGLLQKSDEVELVKIVEKVITDNPQVVADFKNGNEKLLQFLIGQGMKESRGSANPGILARLFKEKI